MSQRANVFNRLSDPSTFTGVYKERFKSGPGINADSSSATMYSFGEFRGEGHVKGIHQLTRTYLNPGGGSAASPPPKPRKSYAPRAALPQDAGPHTPSVHLDNNSRLQLVFNYYCKFGRTGGKGGATSTMDNVNFAKFSRECPGLLDTHLNRTEVDLIFTRIRERTQRRITYAQFLDGLSLMAATKFPGEDPAVAFAVLLEHHVFQCPVSLSLRGGKSGNAADLLPRKTVVPGLAPAPPPTRRRAKPVLDDPDVPLSFSARKLLAAEYAEEKPTPPPRAAPYEPHAYGGADLTAMLEGATVVSTPVSPEFEGAAATSTVKRGLFSHAHVPGGAPVVPPAPPAVRHPTPDSKTAAARVAALRAAAPPSPPSKERIRRPTYAGEANRPGGVYDRLSSPATFTGVYKRAYLSDGRINHYSETGLSAKPTQFKGDTNTGTNETIHDMQVLLRPHLKDGPTFKV